MGLEQVPIPPDQVQDPWGKSEPARGRDPCRTPMPWDGEANAGFTAGHPWLPLNADWKARNVAAERADPDSLLNLYRELLAMRRASPALSLGDYLEVAAADGVLAYERRRAGERMLVALNLTSEPRRVALPEDADWTPVLATTGSVASSPMRGSLALAPDQGVVLRAGT